MDNEERILSLLETLTTDVAGLKTDMTEMKADMTEMKAGQVTMNGRLDRLEAGQAKLEAGQAKLRADVGILKAGQTRLAKKVNFIHNNVTRMENEHGRTLGILLDGHSQLNDKLSRIEKKVNEQDDDILKRVFPMAMSK